MPSTYISLCNQVLRRLNEVEIVSADFLSTTGIQSLVKDAVKSAIAKINTAEFEWPFNAAEETDILTVGQEEYTWPTYFKAVDWNTFQIQASTDLGANFSTLGLQVGLCLCTCFLRMEMGLAFHLHQTKHTP